jgi:hypothetical protein
MRVVRIFTGDDNASHFEDLDVPLEPSRYGSLSAPVPAESVIFRETPAGGLLDYHPAPRRQFVLTLAGVVEVECGDGTKRRFSAGDVMLADDTSGQGHITREIHGPRRSLFITVPDDLDVGAWR